MWKGLRWPMAHAAFRGVFAKRRANRGKDLRRRPDAANAAKMPFVGKVLAGILRPLFSGFVA